MIIIYYCLFEFSWEHPGPQQTLLHRSPFKLDKKSTSYVSTEMMRRFDTVRFFLPLGVVILVRSIARFYAFVFLVYQIACFGKGNENLNLRGVRTDSFQRNLFLKSRESKGKPPTMPPFPQEIAGLIKGLFTTILCEIPPCLWDFLSKSQPSKGKGTTSRSHIPSESYGKKTGKPWKNPGVF